MTQVTFSGVLHPALSRYICFKFVKIGKGLAWGRSAL